MCWATQRCPVLGLKFVRTLARAALYRIDFITSQSGGVETVRHFEGDPSEHRHLLREVGLCALLIPPIKHNGVSTPVVSGGQPPERPLACKMS